VYRGTPTRKLSVAARKRIVNCSIPALLHVSLLSVDVVPDAITTAAADDDNDDDDDVYNDAANLPTVIHLGRNTFTFEPKLNIFRINCSISATV